MPSPSPLPLALSIFTQVYYSFNTAQAPQLGVADTWRPPQWSTQGPTLTIVVPNTAPPITPARVSSNTLANQLYTVPPAPGYGAPPTIYAFDGVIRAEHQQEVVITQHPVQTGANISDHAFSKPARLTIEITMSDAMQSYIPGQYGGSPSRSVSAYQTILDLQKKKSPFSVATRLRQYDNMLIREIRSEENVATRYGLKAQVVFEEIITPSTATATSSGITFNTTALLSSSARPQTTDKTVGGETQLQQVSQTITSQHSTASAVQSGINVPGLKVPGAGYWSSNIISA